MFIKLICLIFKYLIGDATSITDFFTKIKTSYADITAAQVKFNAVTSVGSLNPAKIQLYQQALAGLSSQQQLAIISSSNLDAAQKQELATKLGLISATETQVGVDALDIATDKAKTASVTQLTAEEVKQKLIEQGLTQAEADSLVVKGSKIFTNYQDSESTRILTAETIKNAMAADMLTKEQGELMLSLLSTDGAIKKNTLSLKARTKALWTSIPPLGQIAIAMAAVVAVGVALYKVYDEVVTSAEDAAEATDKLMSSYKSALDTANNNAKNIEGLADKYETLSKGVDNLGRNISLTNDEYAEYNSLANEIADMFPTLIQGYTDEGNAILSLKGNVKKLRDAYKEAQQEAYNLLITSGEDTDGNNIILDYQNQVDGYSTFIKDLFDLDGEAGAKDVIDIITRLTGALTPDEFRETYDQLYEEYKDVWSSEKIQNALKSSGFEELTHKWGNITEEDLANVKHSARATIQTYQAEINSKLKNVQTLANAYLMTNEDYAKLDEDSKNAASVIVNSIDEGIADGFETKEDVGAYVANIIDLIKNNPELKDPLIGLFTTDFSNMSTDDAKVIIDEYIEKIADILGEDPVELKVRLGFTTYDDAAPLQKKVQGFLSDDVKGLDDRVGELTLSDLEIAAELDVDEDSIQSWEQLLELIEKAKNETKQVLTNVERLASVESLSKGFDQLDEIYADVLDGKEFDYSSILNNEDFSTVFSGYTEEYSNFIETISKSPKDINACQDSFNKLATAYIYDKAALEDVTEETKEATIIMLKQMGISNADIIVKEQLAINTANLADAQANLNDLKEKGVDSSLDLENATAVELISLIDEADQAGHNTEALQNYLLKKIQANQIAISTNGDIQNLADLCGRLGLAGTALEKFAKLKETTLGAPYASGQSKNSVPTLGVSNFALNNPSAFINEVNNKLQEVQKAKDNQAEIEKIEAELQKALVDFANGNYKANGKYTGGDASNSAKESLEDSKETFDWVERLISNIQRKITNLGKTVDATYKNWTTRNSALATELSYVSSEINAQQKAASTYWAKANSVGLSQSYKDLVNSGNYSIQDIDDETIKEKIQEYEEWANKAKEAEDAVADLKAELANLAKTKFDNVISAFEDELSVIEHRTSMIEGELDQIEAQGYIASTKYYDKLILLEDENIKKLGAEYTRLKEELAIAMANGNIEKYSSDWYEMTGSILDVESALQEANTQLIEYKNSLRELKWEVFDKTQEMISQIQSESDWLIDLMSNEKMYDGNGNWTEYADATAGLHAVNYNAYMSQAGDYAKEIEKINKDLAKDPYNTILLERRQELLEAQRDMISSAEDEKQAMKDLVSEGYNTMLEALQEMVDKRKEALQAEKDLYDYEKTISEKTKNIGSLEKQLISFEGDDSEETQAKIQQIKVDLEAAREDLEQTEYERYLSDQEQMLDTLVDDTEQWINERLDHLDEVIREVIASTNADAESIKQTLTDVTGGVGTTLTTEMETIWGAGGTVVTEYGKFNTQLTTVNGTLDSIKGLVQSMVNASDKEADKDVSNVEKNVSNVQATQSSSTTSSTPNTNVSNSNNQSNSKNSNWKDAFVSKVFKGNKNSLNKERSIVDMLKYHNIASEMSYRAKYYEAMGLGSASSYRGTSSQNSAMLKKMKEAGYKVGSRRIPKDQLTWTQENGQELIYRSSDGAMLTPLGSGDAVFTAEMTQRLWDFAKNPNIFSNLTTATLPKGIPNNGKHNNVQNDVVMNITLPGVQDVDGFINELRTNKRFEKVVQSMTIGTINPKGSNSFNKLKY